MTFPDYPRVIYEINPIDEAVCQLRFPSILKIDAGPPADFQERIRANYPLYKAVRAGNLLPGLPDEMIAKLGVGFPPLGGQNSHLFSSKDERTLITLTSDSLSLTCQNYQRWEDFKSCLEGPLRALVELYGPAFFSRVGLRYRNIIRRSRLGLTGSKWDELLQPYIAGCLSSEAVADSVEQGASWVLVGLPDRECKVQLQYGLVPDPANKEQCFLIDADFFAGKQTEVLNAVRLLDFLHNQARLCFRWCIKDTLHDAMRPQSI